MPLHLPSSKFIRPQAESRRLVGKLCGTRRAIQFLNVSPLGNAAKTTGVSRYL